MVDEGVLDWLRKVHGTTEWTASVCTGALILGAAEILNGQRATTHWYKMGVLRIMSAKPRPDERSCDRVRDPHQKRAAFSRHRSRLLENRTSAQACATKLPTVPQRRAR
jgi:hypothetical protein